MRKLLVTSGLGLLAAVPARAADIAPGPYLPPPAVTAFDWTGGYVGGNFGGAWGKVGLDPIDPADAAACGLVCAFSAGRDGAIIGGPQVGYRFRLGPVVLGVEQDFQWTDVKRDIVFPGFTPAVMGPGWAGNGVTAKLDWTGATRGTAGVAWDRFLVYAAGGLATGAMDVSPLYTRPGFGQESRLHTGWTLGGGLDYALTKDVFLGIEYRYVDLGKETYTLGGLPDANGRYPAGSADVKSHEVLARANVKFDALLGLLGLR